MHYIVQPGDTMHSIAMNNETTVSDLMALNPQIRNPHRIYPGERITISSSSNHWGRNRWDEQNQWQGHNQGQGHDQWQGHNQWQGHDQRDHNQPSQHHGNW